MGGGIEGERDIAKEREKQGEGGRRHYRKCKKIPRFRAGDGG